MTEERQTEEHHDYLEEERVPEHSGTNHSMAIGFYIAALILIYGVTMVLVGIISPAAPSEGDLGFNVNLWWGLVMVVSGCVILGMTLASPSRGKEPAAIEHSAWADLRRLGKGFDPSPIRYYQRKRCGPKSAS